MKKRVISLLLALTIAGTLFSACGAKQASSAVASQPASKSTSQAQSEPEVNADPYHITDEPVTFTFAAAFPTSWGEAKDKQFFEDLEKKTNVHIEWQQFPLEVAAERVGVIMAGSDLPDAFFTHNNFSLTQANKYGMQGLFMDVKPLAEQYAPNMVACYDAVGGWKEYDAGNGSVYAINASSPGFQESGTVYTELIINKKMLEATGLPMPTTTEEYYEVLKAMKGQKTEDGKDVLPLSYGPVYGYGDMLRGAFGLIDSTCGPSIMDGAYLQYDGKAFTSIANVDNYKAYIQYMNRLYTEGLLDNEVYSHDNNMFNAKGANGQLGSFVDYGGWTTVGQEKIENGDYVVVPVLAGPDGTKLTQNRYNPIRNACDMVITKDCENPEVLMKWINLLYAQDLDTGLELTYGPKGLNWDYDADGKIKKTTPIPEQFASYGEFRASETIPAGPRWSGPEIMGKEILDGVGLLKATMDKEGGYNEAATLPVAPLLGFTEEEMGELTILRTDIMEYVKGFEAACIAGQKDVEAEWDNYKAQLEKLGLPQMVKIYNDALARYNAK